MNGIELCFELENLEMTIERLEQEMSQLRASNKRMKAMLDAFEDDRGILEQSIEKLGYFHENMLDAVKDLAVYRDKWNSLAAQLRHPNTQAVLGADAMAFVTSILIWMSDPDVKLPMFEL